QWTGAEAERLVQEIAQLGGTEIGGKRARADERPDQQSAYADVDDQPGINPQETPRREQGGRRIAAPAFGDEIAADDKKYEDADEPEHRLVAANANKPLASLAALGDQERMGKNHRKGGDQADR